MCNFIGPFLPRDGSIGLCEFSSRGLKKDTNLCENIHANVDNCLNLFRPSHLSTGTEPSCTRRWLHWRNGGATSYGPKCGPNDKIKKICESILLQCKSILLNLPPSFDTSECSTYLGICLYRKCVMCFNSELGRANKI